MKYKESEQAALAQRIQVNRATRRVSELQKTLKVLNESQFNQAEKLATLEMEVDEELRALGIDIDNIDFDNVDIDNVDFHGIDEEEFLSEDEIKHIYEKNNRAFQSLETLEFKNYEEYIQVTRRFLEEAHIDLEKDPMEQLFSPEELGRVLKEYDENLGKLKWCKLDYTVIGIASVIAILLDIFIVAIPQDMNFLGKEYKGSPLTKKMKEATVNIYEGNTDSKMGQWLHKSISSLEEYAKVPYDVSRNGVLSENVDGLRPALHRFMTPGHDPILGFIFGVIDIMRGTMTVIDKNGLIKVISNGDGTLNIFSAFIKVFAHLLSDICTKAGIAPPFMSLLELCTGKSPFILKAGGAKVSFNEVARFMYSNGYDMRHMLTMGIVPLTVELIIRTYYNFYYFDSLLDHEKDIRHKCKKNNMLALSHTVVMGGDILKMWLNGWNPLAFNYAEFLMLVKTIISAAKSNKKYHKMVETALEHRWIELIEG